MGCVQGAHRHARGHNEAESLPRTPPFGRRQSGVLPLARLKGPAYDGTIIAYGEEGRGKSSPFLRRERAHPLAPFHKERNVNEEEDPVRGFEQDLLWRSVCNVNRIYWFSCAY